ncbi:MAG: HAD family phosphatase [Desulfobacteraceae bacterium]
MTTESEKVESKSNNILKAVLIDFGGVFAEEGFRKGIRAIAQQSNVDPDIAEEAAFDLVYSTGYVLGKCNEETFWKAIKETTGIAGDNLKLRDIILKEFQIRPWFPNIITKLREQGLIVCLLSDQTDWLDKLNDRNNFYQLFDHIFNSFFTGKSKSDPGLFDDIADKLGLNPGEIMFVDDYHGHIERAKKKGFKTHLFVEKESFFNDLHKYFDQLNLEFV